MFAGFATQVFPQLSAAKFMLELDLGFIDRMPKWLGCVANCSFPVGRAMLQSTFGGVVRKSRFKLGLALPRDQGKPRTYPSDVMLFVRLTLLLCKIMDILDVQRNAINHQTVRFW